jgi:hypothetical protein
VPNLLTPQQAYELAQKHDFKALESSNISPHFSWGEVFTNCADQEIVECPLAYYDNALKQSALMERVRALFARPIIVHAWYRGPQHNRRVGGAPKSQHLLAAATDFHVLGLEGIEGNREVQRLLDREPWMNTFGMEYTNGGWTHLDSGRGFSRFGRLK